MMNKRIIPDKYDARLQAAMYDERRGIVEVRLGGKRRTFDACLVHPEGCACPNCERRDLAREEGGTWD
jgi:hypothetical protein